MALSSTSAFSKFPNELISEILEATCSDPEVNPIEIHIGGLGTDIPTIVLFSQKQFPSMSPGTRCRSAQQGCSPRDVSFSMEADAKEVGSEYAALVSLGWGADHDFLVSLPLVQTLTSVCLENIWLLPSDTKDLFTRCPQLERCTIWFAEAEEDDIVLPGPIFLPNLRQLDVHLCALRSDNPFDDLTAPQLEELALTGRAGEEFPCKALLEFMKRSSCELKVLLLRSEFVSKVDEIIALLKATPNVHTLELRLTPRMEDLRGPHDPMNRVVQYMERLDKAETPGILPNLRTLYLDLAESGWEMLKSRAGQLSSATFYVDDKEKELADPMGQFKEEIRSLRAKGMEVELAVMEPNEYVESDDSQSGSDWDLDDPETTDTEEEAD
ncbi:hypothetical protein FB45DRAFT_1082126 [Roridomyces roridus]|uniref:Uncharacterized protein n=1 Tax=Roridomyces roridus TaxID=1738132 RepID=A0AAD7BPR5_9AGAR|nr:hypothetical protein FB45DRAFT_1082126 [Roridomyces roridus]